MRAAPEGVTMVLKLNMPPGARLVLDPAVEAEMAEFGEEQYIRNMLAREAKFQKKVRDDALEFLSLYWGDYDVKVRVHLLDIDLLEEWIKANQPLDRSFYVHLIEAAGAKALEIGYSQHKSDIAKAKNVEPRTWVSDAWKNRNDRGQSKASFSRMFAPLVKKTFDLGVTAETIARDWLPKGKP